MKKSLLFTLLILTASFIQTTAQSFCPVITGLRVSNITNTNATFDWDTGPFDGYNIEYRATYSTTWVWFGGGSFPHQEMSVFSLGTTYEVRVSGALTYDFCPPSAFITFTTLGSAPAPVPYCIAKGPTTTKDYIQTVQIGTINKISGNNKGYANFTSLSTDVTGNLAIPFTAKAGSNKTANTYIWAIYVDLNNDGDFLDAGETIGWNFVTIGTQPATWNIIIPTSLTGPRRMRIIMQNYFNAAGGSCGSFPSGEVEDYTINITSSAAARGAAVNAAPNISVEKNPTGPFTIFPNPATDMLKVIQPDAEANDLKIFDMAGRMVLAQYKFAGNKTLDISKLNKGMYILTLKSKGETITKKFVKE